MRSPILNLMTMKKPLPKEANDPYECEQGYKTCGSPGPAEDYSKVFCVATGVDCPITSIAFDDERAIQGQLDAALGPPIISLQLSEGGPPCIYNNESFNS